MTCDSETEFTFDPVDKDPNEDRKVELDLFGKCANFWRPNEVYDLGDFVWPPNPDGFCFEKTSAGQQRSGRRQPQWKKVAGELVTDGPISWTGRDAPLSGLNAITVPSAVSEPTGLTIASVSVSDSTKILATYSGGTDGQDFDARFSFTLNGVPRVARQKVQIRLR